MNAACMILSGVADRISMSLSFHWKFMHGQNAKRQCTLCGRCLRAGLYLQGAAGVHIVGDPQYHALQDWAVDMVRDMPQQVQLVQYTNPYSAGVHAVAELIQQDAKFQKYSAEQQAALLETATCPSEPFETFQYCRAVLLVKMANFEIEPHELGAAVQKAIDSVLAQHALRNQRLPTLPPTPAESTESLQNGTLQQVVRS